MTDRINDERRILIAETIGRDSGCYAPNYDTPIFDPFTNANDDYAVLEWMRSKYPDRCDTGINGDIADEFLGIMVYYQIGDYARAALKVLAHDLQ